ncbi:MAG: hypothetical protein ACP5QP_08120, partial [Brevinematia bacterium]
WKEGKPQDTDGKGVFFKYQILEQYEGTLDNIELKENKKALELFKDEYLLKYFFDYETRESSSLLNKKKRMATRHCIHKWAECFNTNNRRNKIR